MFGLVRASTLKKVEQENVRLRMRINELEHALSLIRDKEARGRCSYAGAKDYRGPVRVKPAPSTTPGYTGALVNGQIEPGETSHQDSRPSSSD